MARCDDVPIFQPTEHDLDPVAAPVVADDFAARLSAGHAMAYLLVFQYIWSQSALAGTLEPVALTSSITPVCDLPFGSGQTAQGRGAVLSLP